MIQENRFLVRSLVVIAVASVLCLCFFLVQASLLRSELEMAQADLAIWQKQRRLTERNKVLKSWLPFLLPKSNKEAAYWPALELGSDQDAAIAPSQIATFTVDASREGWIRFGLHLPPGKHQLCFGLSNDGSPDSAIGSQKSGRLNLAPGIYTLNVWRVLENRSCEMVVREIEGEIVQENDFEVPTDATQLTDTWTLKRMSRYPSEIVLGNDTYTARRKYRQTIFTNPRVVLAGIATDHVSNKHTPNQHVQFWIESDAPACVRSTALVAAANEKDRIQQSWLKLPGPLEACLTPDTGAPIRVFDVDRALKVLGNH